jgi:hypothetical protein
MRKRAPGVFGNTAMNLPNDSLYVPQGFEDGSFPMRPVVPPTAIASNFAPNPIPGFIGSMSVPLMQSFPIEANPPGLPIKFPATFVAVNFQRMQHHCVLYLCPNLGHVVVFISPRLIVRRHGNAQAAWRRLGTESDQRLGWKDLPFGGRLYH